MVWVSVAEEVEVLEVPEVEEASALASEAEAAWEEAVEVWEDARVWLLWGPGVQTQREVALREAQEPAAVVVQVSTAALRFQPQHGKWARRIRSDD